MAKSTQRGAGPAGVALLSDAPLGDSSRDYFGFRVYAEAIASLIDNELTDTPLTIALSAPWGGGKTSVAKMVRRRLDDRTASRGHDRPVLACWFDAWMHSDAAHLGRCPRCCGRPYGRRGAAAVAACCSIPSREPMLRPGSSAGGARSDRSRFAAALAALVLVLVDSREIVGRSFGVNFTTSPGAADILASSSCWACWLRGRCSARPGCRPTLSRSRLGAARGSMSEVRRAARELIEQARRGGTLVIYIDDLERCAPDVRWRSAKSPASCSHTRVW